MPYTTRQQIEAKLPPRFLLEALDDDGDGEEDENLFDTLNEMASARVDGYLGQRYSVPFTAPVPGVVTEAALAFLMETLYERRGMIGQANPYAQEAQAMRSRLEKIGTGAQPLRPDLKQSNPSVTVISEPSRTQSAHGRVAG